MAICREWLRSSELQTRAKAHNWTYAAQKETLLINLVEARTLTAQYDKLQVPTRLRFDDAAAVGTHSFGQRDV